MKIISFNDVWEMYRLKMVVAHKAQWENFWALKGVSFDIEQGETVGLIGGNGMGKTTILKLIMGMLQPDRGQIKVNGRVSGLLELGAGFQPELTGLENVHLNVGLFGVAHNEIDERAKDIVSFAEIGRFINAPVKCYSQGMFVRLAFAIAIHVNFEILLIDDILAVGDEFYQRRCIKKILELKEQGKTIIFVSHDLALLGRLCKRALFMKDGRLIKDDLIDNSISLYSQTIGAKEGVAVLEKKPLDVVFNNGSVFFNWNEKLLTPNTGVTSSFFISNQWYSSTQAEWEVTQVSESEFCARGVFYHVPLTILWRISLCEGNEIKFSFSSEASRLLEIKTGHIDFMFINEYARWVTAVESGEFPVIDLQDAHAKPQLEHNVSRQSIGLLAGGHRREVFIPSLGISYDSCTQVKKTQVYNTDYMGNCRLIRFSTGAFFQDAGLEPQASVYFQGSVVFNVPDINSFLIQKQNDVILTQGDLRLMFNNGSCLLAWAGIYLTKTYHLITLIFSKGKQWPSNNAQWDVEKAGVYSLTARGIRPGLGFVEVWRLEITGKSSFRWQVGLEVKQEIPLEEQYMCFMCSEQYRSWFAAHGRGSFPDNFLETDVDVAQRCIGEGSVGVYSENKQFPTLTVRFSKELNNFAKIMNADFNERARIVRIQRVEPEKDILHSPGTYPCLDVEVVLGEDAPQGTESARSTVQSDKLKFVFEKGRGELFWDGVELTKRLGFYTALRCGGRWYDSLSDALWKVQQKDTLVSARGKWQHLPVSQVWEIRLHSSTSIEVVVKMIVEQEIEVDRIQANLMLLERYTRWTAGKSSGEFSDFKDTLDDDWDSVYRETNGLGCIGVGAVKDSSVYMPAVHVSYRKSSFTWVPTVINSDIYHRARVLQMLNSKTQKIPAGEYMYFIGEIKISH
ncbi:MAG: ABC transporter ATP-binding protein [Candidatus Omnitrophota bacterium]|jgi:ABC-type polysaccharide/polyol phosphate transport system ATPase subunit